MTHYILLENLISYSTPTRTRTGNHEHTGSGTLVCFRVYENMKRRENTLPWQRRLTPTGQAGLCLLIEDISRVTLLHIRCSESVTVNIHETIYWVGIQPWYVGVWTGDARETRDIRSMVTGLDSSVKYCLCCACNTYGGGRT